MSKSTWRAVGPAAVVGVLASIVMLMTAPGQVAAQLTVQDQNTPGITPTSLAQLLAGAGVSISNVTYTGTAESSGQFQGGLSIIGFEEGVILSSGWAVDVIGPNTSDGTSRTLGTGGDPDLDALSGFNTQDTTVLEFDFVPQGSTLTFQYVFASEEYNEFANTSFNDVFAFFVNGENCALVPTTAQPVSINTINGGNPFGTNPQNPEFYRNNDPDDPGATINTQADGLTIVLTCTATVNPNVTNHIKLAIADASDPARDSYVFLEAQSFVSSTCGNSILETPEECDDGNTANGDGCSAQCTIEEDEPECGDGKVEAPEECDDGNTANGDGCSAQCTIEEDEPECGDGKVEAPEECDDGNTANGDGCSALCLDEEASDCSAFPCGRNANKVEVCHIPPGNPRNARTICISPNAVDTHIQRHGDSCGPCEP